MIKAVCTACGFQISGTSTKELNEKFEPHKQSTGHTAWRFASADG
jgi:hypothetical protein